MTREVPKMNRRDREEEGREEEEEEDTGLLHRV